MRIRPAQPADGDAVWEILEPTIRGGEVFALPRDMTREAALAYWLGPANAGFVAEAEDGALLGTYYLRPNQPGGGRHVANAGYATAAAAQGKGVARAMCAHSLDHAKGAGYRAMQYNFVVSTNGRAIDTWLRFGFAIVGRLPEAFEHPRLGLVDALVMFRTL